MIRITVELWPLGFESAKKHLGTATIANDGTGTSTRGNYTYTLSRKGSPNSTWRKGSIKGFPRKRLKAWDLLALCLRDALNPPAPSEEM